MCNDGDPAGLSLYVRDPKAWAQDNSYMVLGARTLDRQGVVLVLESVDKQYWRHINTICTPAYFVYMRECPDLFSLNGPSYLFISPQGVLAAIRLDGTDEIIRPLTLTASHHR